MIRKSAVPDAVRALLSDALIVSFSNGILKAANAVIFILVVRTLGKTVAGLFSITTSYVAIALGLALLGLDEILIRESNRQQSASRLFMNFLGARVGLTLLSALALALLLVSARLYEPRFTLLILLFASGQVGDGVLLLCQALFVAQGRTKLVLLTSASISLVRILAGVVIIALGGELVHLFFLYVVTSYAGAGLALWVAQTRILQEPPGQLLSAIKLPYVLQRIRGSFSFFWINLFVLLEFQMDVVLLSILKTVPDVALYGSAITIFTAAWIVPQSYRTAIYMRLAEAYRRSQSGFWHYLRTAAIWSFMLGLMAGLVLAASAPLLFQVLYPDGYGAGVTVLQVLSIQIFLAFANAPATRGLLTLHKERLAAILAAVVFGINLAANLLLIPRYGPLGAAWAKVVSGTAFCLLIYVSLAWARPGRHLADSVVESAYAAQCRSDNQF